MKLLEYLARPIESRRLLHRRMREAFDAHMPKQARLYDVGCGEKPFARYVASKVAAHIGVDLAEGFYSNDKVDLVGSAYEVPAPDGDADAVILSQVIEHLDNPIRAFAEAHRLLRPGGILFLSFPFLYPQHAQPWDFLRYTEFYLSAKAAECGFEIAERRRIGGIFYAVGLHLTIYLQGFNRGVLRYVPVVPLIRALIGHFCMALHKTEELALRMSKKDVEAFRSAWTVDYVFVLVRK